MSLEHPETFFFKIKMQEIESINRVMIHNWGITGRHYLYILFFLVALVDYT